MIDSRDILGDKDAFASILHSADLMQRHPLLGCLRRELAHQASMLTCLWRGMYNRLSKRPEIDETHHPLFNLLCHTPPTQPVFLYYRTGLLGIRRPGCLARTQGLSRGISWLRGAELTFSSESVVKMGGWRLAVYVVTAAAGSATVTMIGLTSSSLVGLRLVLWP